MLVFTVCKSSESASSFLLCGAVHDMTGFGRPVASQGIVKVWPSSTLTDWSMLSSSGATANIDFERYIRHVICCFCYDAKLGTCAVHYFTQFARTRDRNNEIFYCYFVTWRVRIYLGYEDRRAVQKSRARCSSDRHIDRCQWSRRSSDASRLHRSTTCLQPTDVGPLCSLIFLLPARRKTFHTVSKQLCTVYVNIIQIPALMLHLVTNRTFCKE